MIRIFRHYVPVSLLFIGLLEFVLMMVAIYLALLLRWADASDLAGTISQYLPRTLTFAAVFSFLMFAVGLYQKEQLRDLGTVLSRLVFSFVFGFAALALIYFIVPNLAIWRSAVGIGIGLSFAGIVAFRWLYLKIADVDGLKRRILVLGVGSMAARIDALERNDRSVGFKCVGFVPLSDESVQIDENRDIWGNLRLADLAKEQDVEEIVVALDNRRRGMPVNALLDCKLAGMTVTEYSTFWERETGRVDLDALHPSWMIFSDGFVGGWLQAIFKRGFDLLASLTILVWTFPLLILTAIAVRLESPGSILYRQERVGLLGNSFMVMKFRSMRNDAEKDGVPKWAAVNDSRVTTVGRIIRKSRIDEIPQVLNVFKGEMSLIGPRPERPFFVDKLGEIIPYYAERHRVKPGISGWAQLNYPYGASDEDAVQKFQYDLYYVKNYSLFLDLLVLVQTVRVVLWPVGVR
jgi:sugar transferase (PEP-CTERM system associated)